MERLDEALSKDQPVVERCCLRLSACHSSSNFEDLRAASNLASDPRVRPSRTSFVRLRPLLRRGRGQTGTSQKLSKNLTRGRVAKILARVQDLDLEIAAASLPADDHARSARP